MKHVERGQRLEAFGAVLHIDIEHDKAFACRYADVAVSESAAEPLGDLLGVGGCLLRPILDGRRLAVGNKWEDAEAFLGQRQRVIEL